MATIPTSLFDFLEDLADHNDREWFASNKGRYVDEVQEPALEFVRAFAPKLAAISPHFTADAKVVGGSLFRIHRDTRFSKDKTPYKINTGMQFRHELGKDAHAPGYYIHLQPGESFAGLGLWRPETRVAYDIRAAIDECQADWKRAAHGKAFRDRWQLAGDSLQRPPKGYSADHPCIDDLKRKDFIASCSLSEGEITSDEFLDTIVERFKKASLFMRFLCDAVGVPF